MNNKNIKLNNSIIIFLFIALFYAIGNFIWWKLNTPIIVYYVSAYHLLGSISNDFLYLYAPLLSWIMKILFYIFGTNNYDLQIIFVNYLFFLISLYFIYKISTELKDKIAGNIAMILFSLTPAIYLNTRFFGHQDYHIIAPLMISMYLLIKTNHFENRKWSILYGISIGIGLLTKDTFLPYFIAPFIFIIFCSLLNNNFIKRFANILISIMFSFIICGIHYFRNFVITKVSTDNICQPVPINFETTRCLTTGLWEEILSPPIFILFIIGFIYFILKYKNNSNKFIVLIWFVCPWLLIFFMKHYKSVDYCLGFIPALILITSVFISNIKNMFFKKCIFPMIIILLLVQYVDFSYCKKIKFFYESLTENINICYFRNTINYDEKICNSIFKVGTFVKNNFPNSTIGLSETLEGYVDDDSIDVFLKLLDVKTNKIEIFNNILQISEQKFLGNMSSCDILLFDNLTRKEFVERCEREYDSFFWKKNLFDENKDEILKTINKVIDLLEQQYHPVYKLKYDEDDIGTVVYKKNTN